MSYDPGVYDLTDEEYFGPELASTTLSSTGVRQLLTAPAKFDYARRNPEKPKRTFDVGHAAHQLVLGAGPELVVVTGTGKAGPDTWANTADKEKVQAVRDRGAVPLRPSDAAVVHAMADAIEAHPKASRLFSDGLPERTLIWRDEATGVMCRCKVDWLKADGMVDFKSAADGHPEHLPKTVHNFGHYIQDAFYRRGFRAVFGIEPYFVFVTQEKEPPYLITPGQLTERAVTYGDRKCSEALAIYHDCVEADVWPGYTTEIEDIDLPAWVRTEEW